MAKTTKKRLALNDVQTEKVLYVLLIIIIVAALAGMILLLSQVQSMRVAIFELTAFSISIVAVILAVLGMITNIHQVRTVRRIARDIRGTLREIKDLDRDGEAIKRKLNQDYAVSREIAEGLTKAGIIKDDDKSK